MNLVFFLCGGRFGARLRPKTSLTRVLSRSVRADSVSHDVVLFEHQRPRFFRLLGLFCGAQAGFWAYLAHFGFTSLRDTRERIQGQERDGRNLGSPLWRVGFTISCLTMGGLILAAGLLFSRRSVSAVTLHRGGDRVTIVTAGLFGFGSSFTVPLRHISSMAHRSEVPAMIPLKIKGKPLYFLLDKQGQVSNAKLFDITVGAYRKL
ncbi:transmembrane protein 223 isoform X1 [Spea bombifrons]|uniref:transmembrane protein 223 isoform X1 n=1 Tax=Spea bombifrons TaxID=233779 RepID=UPI00234A5BD7|nr:transmembrane protein 223 isoform X1 [Spea bombifrons]